MAGLLPVLGPRALSLGVFVVPAWVQISDPAVLSQNVAFVLLFTAFASTLFSDQFLLSAIPGVASFAYWKMINDEPNREYYRYADWAITTPMMLAAILLANGSSLTTLVGIIVLDLVMIATGYLGAIATNESQKMKLFGLGCLVFLPILYALYHMKKAKYAIYLTLALWTLYPLIWYLDEENMITKQNTTISYSVMDVISKVGLVNLLHI
jgi:bacteriorhodopsin